MRAWKAFQSSRRCRRRRASQAESEDVRCQMFAARGVFSIQLQRLGQLPESLVHGKLCHLLDGVSPVRRLCKVTASCGCASGRATCRGARILACASFSKSEATMSEFISGCMYLSAGLRILALCKASEPSACVRRWSRGPWSRTTLPCTLGVASRGF